jgi:hypothetical protein
MATAFNLPISEDGTFLSSSTFTAFEKQMAEAEAANNALSTTLSHTPKISGSLSKDKSLVDTLSNGISPEKAKEMLAADIQTAEEAVRKTLKSSNVIRIPQNVFDGLVSFYNQVGDITYAYVGGAKIDLTCLYKNSEWDRAAGFIAADDRDRARRIREAAMMVSNDYGPDVDDTSIIRQGLNNTNELIVKGKLNAQTGNPATSQQLLAASTNYLNQTGKAIPNQSFAITNLANNNELNKIINNVSGPWPY